ncbi:LptF/LptG family permease [Thermodesulfatator autotrophicus]|uniref:Lipopolysaccharide export system permease protein LptF n=1 Tax=Thermodesulfatator autotrophicus TaxID=1795632 RepID=A0A177E6W5_9BACT|nr:LptF/LptG family permease [Thermodesulfatator autotrophicus]OAG27684.1 hypothetical protein TH606_05675 [Thermodesulfatator autotrophicus]
MILFRYLSLELWKSFFLTLFSLTSLLLLARFISLLVKLAEENLTAKDYLKLISFFIPFFLAYLLPLAALMASIFLFMRLVQDKELLALESLGLSFERLMRPVLVFSIATLLLSYFVTLAYLPWSKHAYRTFLFELTKRKIEKGIPARAFVPITPGITLFVKDSWKKGQNFAVAFIIDETQSNKKGLIFARKGNFHFKKGSIELTLNEGSLHIVNKDFSSIQEIQFKTYIYRTQVKELNQKRTPSRGEMGLKELKSKALSLPEGDDKQVKYLVEYYRRLSFPWAAFFLPLIGSYLGAMIKTSGRVTGGVIAIVLYLGYYFSQSIGVSLAESKILPPQLAMNIPNVLLVLILIFFFYLTKKQIIRPH